MGPAVFPSPLPVSISSPEMSTEVLWKSVVHPLCPPEQSLTLLRSLGAPMYIQCLLRPLGPTPACVSGQENRELVSRRTAGWWAQSNLASETGDQRV